MNISMDTAVVWLTLRLIFSSISGLPQTPSHINAVGRVVKGYGLSYEASDSSNNASTPL